MRKSTVAIATFVFAITAFSSSAQAAWSIGANLGFVNADQKDINKEIEALNLAGELGNAWEMNAHLSYRFQSSIWQLMFRPGYFFHPAEDGGGSEYEISGFSFFPMLRFFMLENQTIHLFGQFGVGYGMIDGKIKDPDYQVEFSGGSTGYIMGLGVEFCFVAGHCMNVEGNVRFLGVDRLTVDSSSGTPGGNSRVTQIGKGKELEIDDRDFAATMSGIVAMIGYTMYF